MAKIKTFLNRLFHIEENQTTVKTELIAGLTTFFAMCYIVIVNPNQMTGFTAGMTAIWNACFIGGIVAAVIATVCMAFIANKPFALAAGMGLNSFFFVSFILPCLIQGMNPEVGYATGLAIILISGLIFLILSVTGARKYIATSLPKTLKAAIPAGIGAFIAFLGFQNSGLVVDNPYTLVQFADFTHWVTAAPAIVAFFGFILIVVFARSNNRILKGGSVILGILGATALYYIFSIFTPELRVAAEPSSIGQMFSDWFHYGFSFVKGFKTAFDGLLLGSIFSTIMLVITFCLVDMFDTVGTLYGASASVGMVDENGDPLNVQQEMLCDSIGTVVGAMTGTSTITTFVESSAGIGAGGRTGLTALTTAFLFFICIFLGPLVSFVPSCATAAALIYVGVLMFKGVTKINWEDPRAAATAFMTITMMLCTYSITNGIMIGAMTYVLFTLLTRKFEKKDIVVTVIAVLGLLKFILVAM